MNIVYAVKIFVSLAVVLGVMRLVVGKGLREVTTPDDWKAAWTAILGVLVVSCFSWRIPLFFIALAAWAMYAPRLFDKGPEGRLPAYALIACICPQFTMQLKDIGPIQDVLRLDAYRVLEIVLLVPEAWRLLGRRHRPAVPAWLHVSDLVVYGYLVYWTTNLFGQQNMTSIARESVSAVLDTVLPYYVLSRGCVEPEVRRRVLAMFMFGAAYECFVAMAEALSRHLLYGQLQYLYETRWNIFGALMRGSLLRAQAGLPAPLVMAVLAMFGIGLWVALRPVVRTRPYTLLGLALLGGLLATISRGPLLALAILPLGMVALRFVSQRKLLVVSLVLTVVVSVCWKMGLGDAVIGLVNSTSADETADFNVLYRQQLLDTSIALIEQSPWFGVPNYMQYLQALKQGEGLVDLVNTYLVVTLNVGLVGLALFLVPYAIVLWNQASPGRHESEATAREGRAWNPLVMAILAAVFTVSPVSIIHHVLVWLIALALARLQEGLPQRRQLDLLLPLTA